MHLAVTGSAYFLDRHAALIRSLTHHVPLVTRCDSGNLGQWLPLRIYNRLTRGTRWHGHLLAPDPNPIAFAIRSSLTEKGLGALNPPADMVLHIFGTFSPVWRKSDTPCAFYLDFTMSQAIRHWPPWASFPSERSRKRWLERESAAYARARHIFVTSAPVQESLVGDYGIPAAQISVVGHGASIAHLHAGTRSDAGMRILFDGSDLHRKGGDVLLAAWPLIRQALPTATLTVVGGRLEHLPPGVANPGLVPSSEMERWFLASDLIVAPARCDPFPGFVIEAMNYGVPSIVSAASGLARVVQEHHAGLVVQGFDPATYAAAIVSLLKDPTTRAAMALAGQRVVRDHLNWDRVAARMAPFLEPRNTAFHEALKSDRS